MHGKFVLNRPTHPRTRTCLSSDGSPRSSSSPTRSVSLQSLRTRPSTSSSVPSMPPDRDPSHLPAPHHSYIFIFLFIRSASLWRYRSRMSSTPRSSNKLGRVRIRRMSVSMDVCTNSGRESSRIWELLARPLGPQNKKVTTYPRPNIHVHQTLHVVISEFVWFMCNTNM